MGRAGDRPTLERQKRNKDKYRTGDKTDRCRMTHRGGHTQQCPNSELVFWENTNKNSIQYTECIPYVCVSFLYHVCIYAVHYYSKYYYTMSCVKCAPGSAPAQALGVPHKAMSARSQLWAAPPATEAKAAKPILLQGHAKPKHWNIWNSHEFTTFCFRHFQAFQTWHVHFMFKFTLSGSPTRLTFHVSV
jgi:hypothetical protein